jgi:hypothetical protein
MPDIFERQQEAINRVKRLNVQFDENGRYITSSYRPKETTRPKEIGSRFMTKDKVLLPCDDIPHWYGFESCAKCPEPCEEVEPKDKPTEE